MTHNNGWHLAALLLKHFLCECSGGHACNPSLWEVEAGGAEAQAILTYKERGRQTQALKLTSEQKWSTAILFLLWRGEPEPGAHSSLRQFVVKTYPNPGASHYKKGARSCHGGSRIS